jgi:hypothetical protein
MVVVVCLFSGRYFSVFVNALAHFTQVVFLVRELQEEEGTVLAAGMRHNGTSALRA